MFRAEHDTRAFEVWLARCELRSRVEAEYRRQPQFRVPLRMPSDEEPESNWLSRHLKREPSSLVPITAPRDAKPDLAWLSKYLKP